MEGFLAELMENEDQTMDDTFIRCYQDVDKVFLELASESDPPMKDGSTAISALYWDRCLYVANTGDSRGIMKTPSELIVLSHDQKPDDEEEVDRITRNGGVVTGGRIQGILGVARAFGDIDYKDKDTFEEKFVTCLPEIRSFAIIDGFEFIVLACDGLWDVMSNEEVCQFVENCVNQSMPASAIAEDLTNEAYERESADNITVIVILATRVFNRAFKLKKKKKDKEKEKSRLDIYHSTGSLMRKKSPSKKSNFKTKKTFKEKQTLHYSIGDINQENEPPQGNKRSVTPTYKKERTRNF
eukprot:TRINITY_DN5556_c0_g1_i1.p1 TRINITY_DN5556_c0_g1~~TRINITY_DN5556_c0_g1_i1.p1  ORF type:complete len:298 (+),score=65.52 TRINITY_DN5556_c0_g1_i1:247-1140(+)